jgi:hypothetical protein
MMADIVEFPSERRITEQQHQENSKLLDQTVEIAGNAHLSAGEKTEMVGYLLAAARDRYLARRIRVRG